MSNTTAISARFWRRLVSRFASRGCRAGLPPNQIKERSELPSRDPFMSVSMLFTNDYKLLEQLPSEDSDYSTAYETERTRKKTPTCILWVVLIEAVVILVLLIALVGLQSSASTRSSQLRYCK